MDALVLVAAGGADDLGADVVMKTGRSRAKGPRYVEVVVELVEGLPYGRIVQIGAEPRPDFHKGAVRLCLPVCTSQCWWTGGLARVSGGSARLDVAAIPSRMTATLTTPKTSRALIESPCSIRDYRRGRSTSGTCTTCSGKMQGDRKVCVTQLPNSTAPVCEPHALLRRAELGDPVRWPDGTGGSAQGDHEITSRRVSRRCGPLARRSELG